MTEKVKKNGKSGNQLSCMTEKSKKKKKVYNLDDPLSVNELSQ